MAQESWYIGFSTYGYPQDVIGKLFRLIQNYELSDFANRVCYEKSGHSRSAHEFYLFIGVSGDVIGHIPAEYRSNWNALLQHLRLRDQDLHLTYEQIQKMIGRELESQNFRKLKALPMQRIRMADPFGPAPATEIMHTKSDSYNELLYWVSARGHGSMSLFRQTCDTLGIKSEDGEKHLAGRLMRRLRMLGHAEVLQEGRKFIAAPTCLVRMAPRDGKITYYLAGRRSVRLLEHLRAYAQPIDQSSQQAPDCVYVYVDTDHQLKSLIDSAKQRGIAQITVVDNAAQQLATHLPYLDDWCDALPEMHGVEPSLYELKRWANGQFTSFDAVPRESGMFHLTRTGVSQNAPQLTLFYDAPNNRWLRGDWYGLRFLTLQAQNVSCEAHYKADTQELAVPFEQRWPDLYERALVLASGSLPQKTDDWLIFEHIYFELAHMLAQKLGVVLKSEANSAYA